MEVVKWILSGRKNTWGRFWGLSEQLFWSVESISTLVPTSNQTIKRNLTRPARRSPSQRKKLLTWVVTMSLMNGMKPKSRKKVSPGRSITKRLMARYLLNLARIGRSKGLIKFLQVRWKSPMVIQTLQSLFVSSNTRQTRSLWSRSPCLTKILTTRWSLPIGRIFSNRQIQMMSSLMAISHRLKVLIPMIPMKRKSQIPVLNFMAILQKNITKTRPTPFQVL